MAITGVVEVQTAISALLREIDLRTEGKAMDGNNDKHVVADTAQESAPISPMVMDSTMPVQIKTESERTAPSPPTSHKRPPEVQTDVDMIPATMPPQKKLKKKNRVSWADDSGASLVQVKEFELDDVEMASMHLHATYQNPHEMEIGEFQKAARRMEWVTPSSIVFVTMLFPIDFYLEFAVFENTTVYGANSEEINVQLKRESVTLMVDYSALKVDSPDEPSDIGQLPMMQPEFIPWDDQEDIRPEDLEFHPNKDPQYEIKKVEFAERAMEEIVRLSSIEGIVVNL